MGFGRHVGLEIPAKSEKKSIEKRIEKMMKKRCVLDAAGGRVPRTGNRPAASWDPLITTKYQNHKATSRPLSTQAPKQYVKKY